MSMDMEASIPLPATDPKQQQTATILCCNCGAPIDGTNSAGALCHDCVKLTVDISEGIQREGTLHMCRDCDRWLSPPSQWVMAAPESRELLALCLRKLRGLSKSRIIDASFIWTEPHSRRIKVKISIQQEAYEGAIIQQTFEVEFVIATYQCPDCAKSYTHNTWRASVQVRQKVPHKRTFLYLEQLILKHNAHRDTINIKEADAGLDFFFAARNTAEKFIDFLSATVPIRTKKSAQLISQDVHTSTKSYKFTFSVELVPLCKDDLLALPLKLAHSLSALPPIVLVSHVGTSLQLLDPTTLHTADLHPPTYFRAPFRPLSDARQLTEFIILDIEPTGTTLGRWALADATVRRASDFAAPDARDYHVRTHLGALLRPGDSALGYHLAGANFNSPELEAVEASKAYRHTVPDVVLVKKAYPARARKRKQGRGRNWRLRRMAREAAEEEEERAARGRDRQGADEEEEYEMFLRDVEEDPELRRGLNLYKAQVEQARAAEAGMEVDGDGEEEEEEEDDDGLEIPLDQLRDEFEDMTMEDTEV